MPSAQIRTDGQLGPLSMVAVKRDGTPVERNADAPAISASGRCVTYTSKNTAVVGKHQNGSTQIFRFDRRTGTTVLVSATPTGEPGDGDSDGATMSADGSVVAFETEAGDLLPGSPQLIITAIVARDLSTGRTSLVSRTPAGKPANNGSIHPLVTADGSMVGFKTYATDITGTPGAVVFDRNTETSAAVTVDTSDGPIAVEEGYLSGDGASLVFASTNDSIVPGDDNAAADTFLLNRSSGAVTLVSRVADGGVANGWSQLVASDDSWSTTTPNVSADGATVVFVSDATDLAGAAHPGGGDYFEAYAFDVASGRSELVSVLPDGTPSADELAGVSISPDGRYVVVTSQAFLVDDPDTGLLGPKVFVRDLQRQKTRAASDNQWSLGASVGGTQPHVVFTTYAALVTEDVDKHIGRGRRTG